MSAGPFAKINLPWSIHVVLAASIIFAVAAANGRPSVFPDTAWYYTQGEYLASRLGIDTARSLNDREADPTSVLPHAEAMRTRIPATVAGGRSPFYGLLLVTTVEAGTLWFLAAIQAVLAAWLVSILTRASFPAATPRMYYANILVLSLFTSLPFFAAFAMPDVFAGFLIICIAVQMVHADQISRASRMVLWMVLSASVAFHAANVILASVLLIAAVPMLAAFGNPPRAVAGRAAWPAVAIATALISGLAFGAVYRADAGIAQRTPPFLMARLIADGPGHDYLAAACPGGASPTLCRFKERPMASEDEILWSENPKRGVFNISDYETRMRLKDEEPAFVLAVVARSPLETLRDVLGNGFVQLGEFYVLEPMRNPAAFLKLGWWRRTAIERIVPHMDVCERDADACNPRMDGVLLAVLHIVAVFGALCFLCYSLVRIVRSRRLAEERRSGGEDLRRLLSAGLIITAGVILNAFVCGAISGHFARYQARVVWLVPLMAALMAGYHAISDEADRRRG